MKVKAFNTKTEIDEALISEPEREIRKQVEEFLNCKQKAFDLSISFPDSFTGEAMREISRIPYGEKNSYGEIAARLDSAAIAVGQACGRNPVPLIVPCHRVVGKDSLGGYSGSLKLKRKLLEMEKFSGKLTTI